MIKTPSLANDERQQLLGIARLSIEHGLEHGAVLTVENDLYSSQLQNLAASFVTLTKAGTGGERELRGCIGSLRAYRPLATDVGEHAFAAAFRDPRFPGLNAEEYNDIHIEISVLTPEQAIPCSSETELLQQLNAGEDGLTIREGAYQATFLPSVWKQLPDKKEFLLHLKRKARLPHDYWSDSFRAFRYHTESFEE